MTVQALTNLVLDCHTPNFRKENKLTNIPHIAQSLCEIIFTSCLSFLHLLNIHTGAQIFVSLSYLSKILVILRKYCLLKKSRQLKLAITILQQYQPATTISWDQLLAAKPH